MEGKLDCDVLRNVDLAVDCSVLPKGIVTVLSSTDFVNKDEAVTDVVEYGEDKEGPVEDNNCDFDWIVEDLTVLKGSSVSLRVDVGVTGGTEVDELMVECVRDPRSVVEDFFVFSDDTMLVVVCSIDFVFEDNVVECSGA